MKVRAIDLFCGCGMASLGMRWAGCEPVLAVDADPFARLSYQSNFPDTPVLDQNLFLHPINEIFEKQGLNEEFNGLVWASPPCQGFSTAGHQRGSEDPRNQLLRVGFDAAEALPNAWVVVENVSGLMMEPSQQIYKDYLNRMKTRKEIVVLGWRMNAIYFGLQQDRERQFILMAPRGIKFVPHEPISPHDFPGAFLRGMNELKKIEAEADAEFQELRDNELVLYAEIGPGQNWEASARGQKYARAKFGKNVRSGSHKSFLKRPSRAEPTACVTTAPAGRGRSRVSHLSADELRYMSVGELRLAQGVPNNFLIAGPIEERIKQLGNGVPPIMAEVIARTIYFNKPTNHFDVDKRV